MNLDMELFGAHEWQMFISGGSCLVITSWPASGIHEIETRPGQPCKQNYNTTTRAVGVHGMSIVSSRAERQTILLQLLYLKKKPK
jgi:hypothetical protein